MKFCFWVLVLALALINSQTKAQASEPQAEDDVFSFVLQIGDGQEAAVPSEVEAVEEGAVPQPADPTVPLVDEQQQTAQENGLSPEVAVKAVDIPEAALASGEDVEYGQYADALVNCTDFVPQEQIASGYENCQEVIDSINSFQNLGLQFPLCESEVVWKGGYCQKTCGLCEECEDTPYPGVTLECNTIQAVGLCEEMDIYQNATYCARSCQTCEVLAERQGGSGCTNAKTTQCDADALLFFKSQMAEGAQQELSSWKKGSNPCTDNWKGVKCNDQKFRVTTVQLGDFVRSKKVCSCSPLEINCSQDDCRKYYNASGSLMDTMFGFQESNSTYVAGIISGMYTSIPAQLSQMVYLEVLELTGNEITGTIPPQLSSLTRMKHLVLFDNKINGTIPPEFSSFVNMQQELHLGSNDLSGVIPKELSVLDKLWGMYLSDNYLSGTVPVELSVLGKRLYSFNIEPQYDDKLCIANTTAEYLEAQVQMETDVGQLTICQM